ncbi:MAG: AzlC family ABC transporter permease [Cardiobacteriaceae bacterium]|nr:AzlC family ABC transporter permease [Cardiobacteriaceae bacterium]
MSEVWRGVKACIPMLFGIIPFALILGTEAARQGMMPAEIGLMMALNFAGGSEFAAVGMWVSPLPIALIIGTTFLINSRHILMGAALAPVLGKPSSYKAAFLLFFMTDESWALAMRDANERKRKGLPPFSTAFYMGTAIPLYISWASLGYFGASMSQEWGDIERFGVAMAFPAVFLVIIRGMWRTMYHALPWLVSLIAAAVTYLLVPKSGWYVMVGTLAGLVAAYYLKADKRPVIIERVPHEQSALGEGKES